MSSVMTPNMARQFDEIIRLLNLLREGQVQIIKAIDRLAPGDPATEYIEV